MKLSVVIPARNEAGNIGITLDNLRRRLAQEGILYEIVVVDDGSRDTTPQEVEQRVAADQSVRLVHNPGPHGFGMAVRCGVDAFTGDAVVIVMADDSDDPEDVVKYYYILRDKAECAFGSRWIRGGRAENYPPFKGMLNRLANTFISILFGLHYSDVTNAFKGYRRYVIDGCRPLLSAHFNLTVEIPLKAIVRGYSYEVIPISWRNRRLGKSYLHIEEMASRYLYIVLNVWLEKLLTKGDYHRPDGEAFVPWSKDAPGTRKAVSPSLHVSH
jgi:dolichol-phosphate mannosyltransferase